MIVLYRSDYNSGTGAYYATLIATYAYDPWGNPTGIYNPNGTSIARLHITPSATGDTGMTQILASTTCKAVTMTPPSAGSSMRISQK